MNLFSSFTLKIMAIIFMAMDHVYTYFNMYSNMNNPHTGSVIPIWFGYFGKIAAPIFFYLVVEGFFHTRSKKNYIIRVFAMGLLMVGIDMAMGIHNNIFLSIGCSLVMLTGIDYAKNGEKTSSKVIGIIIAILFGVLCGLFTEGSIYGIGMTLIFYFFREKKVLMAIAYIIFSLYGLVGMIGPNFIEAITKWDYQWMMVFAIIPIFMYNGKLGLNNKFIKLMFYWFYPIHLVVIVLLAKAIYM